jgi:hypothetical protein
MGGQITRLDGQEAALKVDVEALVNRMDREDILLLKEFYHTGFPYPDDTISHVLRLLVDKVRRRKGPLGKLSYSAIRQRLENLVALGLLGKIPHTNPAVYYPLDIMVEDVKRIILLFAADFVGVRNGREGGSP